MDTLVFTRSVIVSIAENGSTRTTVSTRALRERVVDWLKAHGDTGFEAPGSTLRNRLDELMGLPWDTYLALMRRHEAARTTVSTRARFASGWSTG
jgi:hypothetical protein